MKMKHPKNVFDFERMAWGIELEDEEVTASDFMILITVVAVLGVTGLAIGVGYWITH